MFALMNAAKKCMCLSRMFFVATQFVVAVMCVSRVEGSVVLGIDNLISKQSSLIVGKRIAVVTNQTGVTSDGRRTIDALHALQGTTLTTIFTPEHGLSGTVTAGNSVSSGVDSATGVPVISLYG